MTHTTEDWHKLTGTVLIYLVSHVHGDSSRLPPCRRSGSGCWGPLWGPLTPRQAKKKPQLPSLAKEGFLFLWDGLSCPVCLALWAVLSCVFSPGGLLIPYSCPMDFYFLFLVVVELRLWWPGRGNPLPWPPTCLFCSGGLRPVSCPCVSWGDWVPTPPPR